MTQFHRYQAGEYLIKRGGLPIGRISRVRTGWAKGDWLIGADHGRTLKSQWDRRQSTYADTLACAKVIATTIS